MKQIAFIQKRLDHPLIKSGVKLGGFLVAGLPAFALAIPLNWFLVSRLMWGKSSAYALVLLMQVVVNFFMCRWFVFTSRKSTPLWAQFGQFLSGILLFRLADWALYTFLVTFFDFCFLAVQVVNIIIFSVLKFKFSQKVMEG